MPRYRYDIESATMIERSYDEQVITVILYAVPRHKWAEMGRDLALQAVVMMFILGLYRGGFIPA